MLSGDCAMSDARLLYWDTDVFLSYINEHPERLPIIEAILEEIEASKEDRIVTSTITKVEVAWRAHEKLKRTLSIEEESRIDDLWNNPNIIEPIEFNDEVALTARSLMRQGMINGWKLRTFDAIQIASAEWVQATEINTYNLSDFKKYESVIGIPIRNPFANQPKLFSMPKEDEQKT
jgi:predicted nucleic acid-binding protein